MVDYIKVYDSFPDDRGIYNYETGNISEDCYYLTSQKPKPIGSIHILETNTIRILELENILEQYEALCYSNYLCALITLFRVEAFDEGKNLILQEIKELKASSKIIEDRIDEIETSREESGEEFATIYISSGKCEALKRYLRALTGRNKQNEEEVEEKRMSLK